MFCISLNLLNKSDRLTAWLPRLPFSDEARDWERCCRIPARAGSPAPTARNEETPLLGFASADFLTDEEGKLLENLPIHVKEKEYEKFRKVYQKRDKVKMYLAHGYKKRHCYNSETMETQEYKMGEHDGVLLIYELPDTVKEKKTEAEAYAAVWDIMMELQKELPNSVVYYGQDFLQEEGKRFDEMGVFLPLEHFSDRLERHIEKADQIVYGK